MSQSYRWENFLALVVVSLQDRVALLLSIKEDDKPVDLSHVFEKISRDIAFVEKRSIIEKDVEVALEDLTSKGLATKIKGKYAATPALDDLVEPLVRQS